MVESSYHHHGCRFNEGNLLSPRGAQVSFDDWPAPVPWLFDDSKMSHEKNI